MRLLLDEHLPRSVALQLPETDTDAVIVGEWLGGSHRGASDEQVLAAALSAERVLVTYDCRTVPAVLKGWAETGRHHAGVIFVDEKTLRLNDVGGLLRALQALIAESGRENWHDRVVFLRASRNG